MLLSGVIAGPIVLIGLWMMFEHKPGWYRPVTADDATVKRAQSSTAELVDSISDRLAVARPLEVTLSDDAVNEWLASLPRLWPEAGRAIPREITDLAVRFDAGVMRIGGHFRSGELQSILNLSLAVEVSDDRSAFSIRLINVRGGSLPVPRVVLAKLFEQLQDAAPPDEYSEIRSVDELFEGVTIRNRFVWPNGDRPCRVSSITTGPGELRVGIEPL
jgi:hypothetical protein